MGLREDKRPEVGLIFLSGLPLKTNTNPRNRNL